MFNFMKKNTGDDEKERRKKEKKLRKEAKNACSVSGSMSTDELLRLDEVRRSLKIRGRRKEKEKLPSGITADYSADFFAAMNADFSNNVGYELDRGNEEIVASVTTQIHNTEKCIGCNNDKQNSTLYKNIKIDCLPPIPPKPPKRGILKGSRTNINSVQEEYTGSPESHSILTYQNEILDSAKKKQLSCNNQSTYFTSVDSLRTIRDSNKTQRAMTLPANTRYIPDVQRTQGSLCIITSPSPSAESLTDTTNSSFATPPFSLSPVGESQGFDRWTRMNTFDDVNLLLPPVHLIQLPPPRKLTIHRQKSPRHDFGFSLRKSICLDRTESLTSPIFRSVIFAEPGGSGGFTGLLPGDRLIKVNGTAVGDLSRELIIEMIRNSGDSVTVEVQPVAELVELSKRCVPIKSSIDEEQYSISNGNCNTLKRSACKRFMYQHCGSHKLRSLKSSKDDTDRVWLIHRQGFTSAIRLPASKINSDNNKVIVKLEHNDDEITVDEDNIEKQNLADFDLVEDICDLPYLNEASVLHTIRQRYANNLIHTNAGPILVVVNPMAPLSLYSDKVISMFRGCKTEDMPPHIYSLAQTAYRTMLESRRDQSLVFMGRSGSGKTTSFKHALSYLTIAAGSYNNFFNSDKVNALCTILDAFGNTETCLNINSSRFTQLLSLDFDQSGQIVSASLQVMLLERKRAGLRVLNDKSFHIMTRLLVGASGLLQKELFLENILSENNHPFITIPHKIEDRHREANEFMRIVESFEILNIDAKAVRGLWNILGAIYHIGVAGVAKYNKSSISRFQFANPSAARKAANLLGITLEDLSAAAFSAGKIEEITSPLTPTVDTNSEEWICLEALVIGLYSEAFASIIALINRKICTYSHSIASIILFDSPGFQNPASCGDQIGATLADLSHNYLQERLQWLFHHTTLLTPQERYAQELIEMDIEGIPESNPGPIVSLIDKSPQNHVVRSSQRDLRDYDRRGLLWLLDEETMYPNSNDETFLDRLFSHYGDREHHSLLRKCTGQKQFILQHLQGTNPVLYSVDGWVRSSREHPNTKNAVKILQDSTREEIICLYASPLSRGPVGFIFYGSFSGLDGTQSLRRLSSIRRSFTSAGVKRNSTMLQMKFTVDGIIDTLRRTGIHFVHCYLLQHNSRTHQKKLSLSSPNTGFSAYSDEEEIVNIPLLRSQLRGSQVLDAARLHKFGFPESVPIAEFVRRFGLLVNEVSTRDITAEQILASTEIDVTSFRIGLSQVLLRSGTLSDIEAKRDILISDRIIRFQAYCRGYLAREKISRRRVQELAVQCIQRNVKVFLAVRNWPWWRLLVKVSPLLNVHRTEEQLKSAKEELILLRGKLEKIESERTELKAENRKLETKLTEMTSDLAEERSTAHFATERLERETGERLKLEKDLNEQQNKVNNLEKLSEKLEIELICAQSDLNGISEEDDADPDNEEDRGLAFYKLKFDRVARELEFTKRRLQTQHEHDLEQLVGLKKQLEKKLSDAYEEVEEQRQVVAQWKRKAQKISNEMSDLRRCLDDQNGRNNLLEKKQRKFDAECQALQDVARQERQTKERLLRENDILSAEKFGLEQILADTRLDLELKDEKLTSLQKELEEVTFGGGSSEEENAQLRRSKNELERRIKDLEEELDEMAGQVQLLEQAKLRLEMNLETMRKEARRESQQRDEELEEVRGNAYKKIKALECQLETEHEERTLLLREKHELERRLSSIEDKDRTEREAEEASILKLKRDLRKYKALLKDAQIQIDRLKADTPGKNIIRQLRNQLEDAESTRMLAMKARQAVEAELAEVQSMLDEANRARNDAEDRANVSHRDRSELQAQIEENEEELSELMKKYSATVKQLNTEQITVSEYEFKFSEIEAERNNLKEQVNELQHRLDSVESMGDPSAAIQSKRLELRLKEIESRLELEQATRARLEVHINRHKESYEKLQNEISQSKIKELQLQDLLKRSQKSLRETRDEFSVISLREQECVKLRKDLEKKVENIESENTALKNDLRLALQRIADLQQAMEDDGDDDLSESGESLSSVGSITDLEHRLHPIRVNQSSTDSTKILHSEKDDNSPRITLTSPTLSNIHKMKALNKPSMTNQN